MVALNIFLTDAPACYLALQIRQCFSQILDVFTLKIRLKVLISTFFVPKYIVANTRLEASLEHSSALQTDLLLRTAYSLPSVSNGQIHGRWQSSLLLYSIPVVPSGLAKHLTICLLFSL